MNPAISSRRTAVSRIVGVLLAILGCAGAQACDSNGTGGGTYSVAATWNAGTCTTRPPGAGEAVRILAGDVVNVTVNPNTISTLTVDGTLAYNTNANRTITVTGSATVTGTVQQNNVAGNRTGTLNIGGSLTNSGTVNLIGPDATDTITLNFNTAAAAVVGGAGTYTLATVTLNKSAAGNTVSFDADIGMRALTITTGTLRMGSTAATARTLTVGNNNTTLTIAANGTLTANPGVTATHTMNVVGSVTNNGTLNLAPDADSLVTTNFVLASAQVLSGTGATNTYSAVNVTKSAAANTVSLNTNGTMTTGAFTITTGTFRFGSTAATARTLTVANGAALTLGASGRLTANTGVTATHTLNLTGDVTDIAGSQITLPADADSLVTTNLTGAAAQTFSGAGTKTFFNVNVNKSAAGNTVTLDSNVTTRALAVNTGTFQLGSTAATNRTLTVNTNSAITIGASGTLRANPAVTATHVLNAAGNITNNGSMNLVTDADSLVNTTLNGTAAQTIGGANAVTFNALTLNNATGMIVNTGSLAASPVVTTTLTFTNGRIDTVTNSRTLVLATGATTSGQTTTRFVNGCMRKNFTSAAVQTFLFTIGSGTSYAPLNYALTGNSAAGDVTACTVATDHPQITTPIPTTGINSTQSVNRYWTLTANVGGTGTPNGVYAGTFNFLAAEASELTNTQLTTQVIIERYDGTNWFPTTIGTRAATSTQATGIGSYGAFAIGMTLSGFTAVPGRFNAFETLTDTNAILGKIVTKVAGATVTLGIVAVNSGKTAKDTTFTGAVSAWLVDSSTNSGGSFDANGCYTLWRFLGTATAVSPFPGLPPVATTSVTFANPADQGRKNTLSFSAPSNAYPDVRIVMRDNASGALIGCSTDRFAIRPKELLVEALDATWQTAGTVRTLNNTSLTDGVVHAASRAAAGTPRPFTLRATARANDSSTVTTNYTGTPTVKTAATCVQPAGCANGVLDIGTWSAASGVASASANYGEAGTFAVTLEDATFAAVDTTDGITTAAEYTIPQSASVEFGRFVPNHFAFASLNTPSYRTYDASCTATPRTFTYIGAPFGWASTFHPQATLQAKNAYGDTTTNYRGSLYRVTASNLTETYSAASGTLNTTNKGTSTLTEIANSGTASYAVASGGSFSFDRGAPVVPFNADISLVVKVNDLSEDQAVSGNPDESNVDPTLRGIITTTPASFASITFSGSSGGNDNEFRYGRLRLQNAVGTPQLDLRVPFTAESYTASGFATNTADNCTTVAASDFRLQNFGSPPTTLTATQLPDTHVQVGAARLSAGTVSLVVQKPTVATVYGSADLCYDLGTLDASCTATSPPATSRDWLLGPWGASTYTKDPKARVSFGVYGSQPRPFIFFREQY